jgi:septal ring factor EnvC (AmiA/AmiB activator)
MESRLASANADAEDARAQCSEWKKKAEEAYQSKRFAEAAKSKLETQLQHTTEELNQLQQQRATVEKELATIDSKVAARVAQAQVRNRFLLRLALVDNLLFFPRHFEFEFS